MAKHDKTKWRGFLAVGGLVALGLIGGAAGGAIGAWRTVCYDCPSIAQLYDWEPRQSTKIFSHDGTVLDELAVERRTPVDIDSLPPYVPQAFIAIEDKRFYGHSGFDVMGYARAVRNQLIGRPGGGSTITLQLARHMFIEEVGFDQSFRRKLRELHVAVDLERVYTKDQILQAYINQINYDQGWYGIESASQNYFGKHATQLNPAEAATLAAVINRPAHYNPLKNPDRSRQRRNLVLDLMARQDYLTPTEARRWKEEPLPETRAQLGASDLAPYFVEWVRSILDDRFGSDLYSKGYRVYTTLDIELQTQAREAMERGWRRIETIPGYAHPLYGEAADSADPTGSTPYLQGLFIAMDPTTGDIKAMIGGRDFEDSKFNRATQARRQPGSIFKPFVYTAAIASGIPASHTILDAPVNLYLPPDSTRWSPRNYTNDFRGEMTMREALRGSVNVPAVKLGNFEVGLETVAQYAKRLGISGTIPRVPSLPIGVPDVIPIDVAEAYSAYANLGEKVEPRPILYVEDPEGRVVWQMETERERVLDAEVAYIMVDMMKDVVNAGSARSIRDPLRGNVPDTLPAAGKTGTTNDASDVWFAGFTPDLLAVVWMGFDMRKPILENAAGGALAAPVWADFMRPVYFGKRSYEDIETGDTVPGVEPRRSIPADWRRPDQLSTRTIDSKSGKLFTEWCPVENQLEELYIPGTEPTELCDLHAPGLFGAPLRGLPQILPDTTPPDTLRTDTTRRDTSGGGGGGGAAGGTDGGGGEPSA